MSIDKFKTYYHRLLLLLKTKLMTKFLTHAPNKLLYTIGVFNSEGVVVADMITTGLA